MVILGINVSHTFVNMTNWFQNGICCDFQYLSYLKFLGLSYIRHKLGGRAISGKDVLYFSWRQTKFSRPFQSGNMKKLTFTEQFIGFSASTKHLQYDILGYLSPVRILFMLIS